MPQIGKKQGKTTDLDAQAYDPKETIACPPKRKKNHKLKEKQIRS
jgi:hypothetical protein